MIVNFIKNKSFFVLLIFIISVFFISYNNHVKLYREYVEYTWKNNYSFILNNIARSLIDFVKIQKSIYNDFNKSVQNALTYYIKTDPSYDNYSEFFFYDIKENYMINELFIDQYKKELTYAMNNMLYGTITFTSKDNKIIIMKKIVLEGLPVIFGLFITRDELDDLFQIKKFLENEIKLSLLLGGFLILIIIYYYIKK